MDASFYRLSRWSVKSLSIVLVTYRNNVVCQDFLPDRQRDLFAMKNLRLLVTALGSLIQLPLFAFAQTAQTDESGYSLSVALTLESVYNLDGGLTKGSRESANLDLMLAIDTEAAGWWSNGEWFVYVLGNAGKNPSEYVGDVQGVSNIATDEAIKIWAYGSTQRK